MYGGVQAIIKHWTHDDNLVAQLAASSVSGFSIAAFRCVVTNKVTSRNASGQCLMSSQCCYEAF